MIVFLTKSDKKDKKYKVYLFDNAKNKTKIINFGQKGYEDYTIHKNELRKQNYISRHKKNEDWNNPFTAGFWAYNLLWNKKTIKESIRDIEDKYDIKIIDKI